MLREEAIELVRQLVEAVKSHDADRMMAFYTDEAVMVSPTAGQITGRAAIREWWHAIFSRFPDWTASVSDVLVDGDRVVFFGTASATDRNGWFGQPPTGERFEYRATIVMTLSGGKIARDERIYDLSGLLERLEKTRLDKELKMAAEVQRALLSRTDRLPPYCEAVANSLPCRAIGGDFLEMVQLASGEFGLALGDVAGKGPAAAILAAMIQGMLSVEVQDESSPASLFTRLNLSLARRHLEPRFATLVYGRLSPNGKLVYSNAGHNPPILVTKSGMKRLTTGGPILGAFNDATFEEETLVLNHGDTLIMFSDGVVEARDAQDREFGEDRLITGVAACARQPVSDVLKEILARVQDFCQGAPQADDITALVARFLQLEH